jgi:hypothetical protein
MIVMLFGGLFYAARYAKLTGQPLLLGIMVTLVVNSMFDHQILPKRFPDWQTIAFWLPIGICIAAELYVRNLQPVNGRPDCG